MLQKHRPEEGHFLLGPVTEYCLDSQAFCAETWNPNRFRRRRTEKGGHSASAPFTKHLPRTRHGARRPGRKELCRGGTRIHCALWCGNAGRWTGAGGRHFCRGLKEHIGEVSVEQENCRWSQGSSSYSVPGGPSSSRPAARSLVLSPPSFRTFLPTVFKVR